MLLTDEQRGVAVDQSRRDHRSPPRVHGLDDLAAVDALQVDAGDSRVAVPELALDDDQWHAVAGHLDGVGVPELMRREAAPHPCRVRLAT